jgi:phage tail-like protein
MKRSFNIFISAVILFFQHEAIHAQQNTGSRSSSNHEAEIKFLVKWDGKIIPGIIYVSELKRITEVLTHRTGGDPSIQRKSPGITNFEPIIIKRPRTFDKEFEQWVNKVWNFGSGLGSEVSLKDFRKDIVIELRDGNDKLLLAFKVYRCWPSEYIALSELDTEDTTVAMETLILQNEGWEVVYGVD